MSETQRIDGPHAKVYRLLRLGRGLRTAAQLERDRDEAERLAATTAAATVPSATAATTAAATETR